MDKKEELLNLLRHGSKEEIGNAIVALSRLKNPRFINDLKEVMNSNDPVLSIMATYALSESGDKDAIKHFEKLVQQTLNTYIPGTETFGLDLNIVEEILKLPQELPDLMNLYNLSYFIEAKEKLLKILNIYRSNPPKTNVQHFDDLVAFSFHKTKGFILNALAISELHLGNIQEALQHSLEAVTIAQEVGDPQLLKISYADLGHIHMSMGNYYTALELLHESLDIDKNSHDPWRKKNRALSVLSQLYYLIGQYENALQYIEEALELSHQENDLIGKTRCLNAKGVIFSNLGEYHEAQKCLLDALSLSKNELKDKTLQGLILTNLSYVYWSLSEAEGARQCLEDALEMSKQMGDKSTEPNILTSMAILDMESENVESAKRHAEDALDISIQTYNPSAQSDANFILGMIEEYYCDDADKAYGFYKEAISISEGLRNNLMLDDFKISFFENYIHLYQHMVSLCINMGETEKMISYIEKSKSRAFIDMLSYALTKVVSKENSDETIEEIFILRGELDLLRRKLQATYSTLSGESHRSNEEIENETLHELQKLENIYKKTYDNLKLKDPEQASLISADVVDTDAVQEMLRDDELVIQFYQMPTELIILTIKKGKPPFVSRVPIDVEKESEKLFSLFSCLSEGKGVDTKSHEYIKNIKQPLSYFYNLLFSPISNELRSINHIIVIPHFFWHYLPFHALYDPITKEYLIDKFSISYAPSTTALNLCLLKNHKQYETALILANPTNDLLFAEEEAEKIKHKFNNNAYLFTGENASFDKLSDYSQCDVIHIACHGYFKSDEPLFSHLVLHGENSEKSCFFLPDLFNLKLKTSLVTLSACQTGLSRFNSGDELIGISRAFFYAGAPSLLTSLWTVNDKSTSLLMDKFYEGLINMGESKARSLKLAMKERKAIPEYSHPYFWAPFFLSGDWK